ncbi:hypothetical protein [Micromonospora auratinigra]|uniref:Uncharacterized protein n=1 Tax=Micromonospora auratinigra TaxID=261654 RepID=A0A1A8ZVV2_9ACTN|nr:hypothetical protein [Micromonospora auratinigra]SBT48003.1 hypothetical protein GA0070611_3922 [Micromonospora auratinigra]
MDPRNPGPDRLVDAFADLRATGLRQVTDPDPDVPRRRAYRRLRNRAALPAVAAAVVAVAGAAGLVRLPAAPPPAVVTGSSPATGLPSGWPSGTPATPSPTASPGPTPTGSPSASATPAGSPSGTPSTGAPTPRRSPSPSSTRYLDLSIHAPRTLTLTPEGGRYTGWLDVTMGNAGTRAYDAGDLIVVLPVEATIDLTGTNIGGCFNREQTDDTKTSWCTGDGPVPSGGTKTYRIGVTVNIAPGGPARTLTGMALTVRANIGGSFPADGTPADNTTRTDLVLPAG